MENFIFPIPPRCNNADVVNDLLHHMVSIGGSDLFILGSGEVWVSRYGRKVKLTERRLSDNEARDLIIAIYNTNAPSMLGAGDPINAAHEFFREEGGKRQRYRFRVNAVGCLRNGRKSLTITLRTIPSLPPHWETYGVEKEIIDVTRSIDQGLILVVGATGNGKSTLLASILRDRIEGPNSHTNLVTIEHPIEFVYDEVQKDTSLVTQLQVGNDVSGFHDGVVNSLRMAPNVILVGESRDLETVQASLEAAMTGHGVFSTVHANNVPETFQRLVYVFPKDMQQQARIDVIQPMKMIVAQRLIPTVDGRRTAIRETMIFDQQDKDMMMESDNIASAAFRLVHSRGRPMVEDAKMKYEDGIISEEVYKRVLSNYQAMKANLG
ncbi:type IV pilus twitching motility protein PilT [Pseudomonas amygdali]|uniref:Defect in organelle trafficking protein DotB (ATPase) n=1 Tax=Pseudomonas amygdali pv. lachrymans str. M301315 TaxID=629260 RepID=A0AAD0M474_PSEAV|nr:ATPase, T2SS/T4P/T4SS family [Pseudomonas amygdali]AXH59494.1 defect in organelle trafficking protein DotB (ATPase) [Pseudomonas amygdali pv. lachrymans str. M301315]RMT05853.1 Defect in organelle trafficking protein DotB [Pseudomonas amygdali pv. lachrymans]